MALARRKLGVGDRDGARRGRAGSRLTELEGAWRDLRTGWRALDPPVVAGLAGGLALLLSGLLSFALHGVVPDGAVASGIDLRLAGATAAAGIAGLLLPWQRWPARALLAYPLAGLALVAVGGRWAGGADTAQLAVIAVLFVFAGFTQPPGTSLLLLPVAVVALGVASGGRWTATLVGELAITLPISAVAGEAVAHVLAREHRAEQRIEHLLAAVRRLARVRSEREGAQVVADLAVDLLEADAVAVLLAENRGGRRFLHRAWGGHPALVEAAPLVLDPASGPELAAGTTVFFPDASALPLPPNLGRGVRSAALVPLPGERDVVGVALALWTAPRRLLPVPARQAAELLSQEAGRTIVRLRATARLARAAETDPLTSLANRRTLQRALDALEPGDAVVVIDLDHFKDVNDRFGHDAGDRTLQALARALRAVSRQGDCVARLGGEEFALVLAGAGEPGARAALDRLRGAWLDAGPVTTFSAGVAVHRGGGARGTLRRADEALYRAKEAGRDRVEFAPAEIVLSDA